VATTTKRWLHLGLGAFHRAHQAVYLHRLHETGDRGWTLASGNIRPEGSELIEALRAQGGEYTLQTVSPDGEERFERIRSITEVIPWDASLTGFVARGREDSTRIISFTVTEAGYYLRPDDTLDLRHPDMEADLQALASGAGVRTLHGALTLILDERMRAGAGPVTLLCCDNLRHNGARSRAVLLDFIRATGDAALLDWVERHTRQPNTMVDRITPRPTSAVARHVQQATGSHDPAALMAESYLQWVVEDAFAAGRPAWEHVGVEMTDDVEPYEEAKIRLLNATHSCVAWAGTLRGLRYIHEDTRDAVVRDLALSYTDEAIEVLSPSKIDLAAYRDRVLARFSNPAILDTNQRVVADSFAKLPAFIVPTIRERLARGLAISGVAMLPAVYLRCLQLWHAGTLPFEYQDQALDPARGHAICEAGDPVAALASEQVVWGELAGDQRLVEALRGCVRRLDGLLTESPGSPPPRG